MQEKTDKQLICQIIQIREQIEILWLDLGTSKSMRMSWTPFQINLQTLQELFSKMNKSYIKLNDDMPAIKNGTALQYLLEVHEKKYSELQQEWSETMGDVDELLAGSLEDISVITGELNAVNINKLNSNCSSEQRSAKPSLLSIASSDILKWTLNGNFYQPMTAEEIAKQQKQLAVKYQQIHSEFKQFRSRRRLELMTEQSTQEEDDKEKIQFIKETEIGCAFYRQLSKRLSDESNFSIDSHEKVLL